VAQAPVTFPSTATVETVTGLTDGTAYDFTVTAVNAVGPGPPSSPSAPVTPATVPGAPTGLSVSGGDGQATLGWSPPASDGGSPVTGYLVTPFVGGVAQAPVTFPSTATVETVGGLTNGTTYDFTVTAVNPVGPGPPSPPSAPVTPATLPGVPTGLSVSGGDGQATVAWSSPASDGGSPVTAYLVTPFVGGVAQFPVTFSSTATVETVTGLTDGTAYDFTVTAVNSVGPGAPSSPSPAVTPVGPPGPPTGVGTTSGDASVTVAWSAPASDGGSPVTGYLVTPFVGGVAQAPVTFPSTATVETVGGLTNGQAYTFTVSAVNALGQGPASTMSDPVTPATVPGAPTITSAVGGDASATITWAVPVTDGGAPVTSYTVAAGDVTTPANGGQLCMWTSGPLTCTVGGLTNGDVYIFGVSATNAAGTGPTSAVSGFVTPILVVVLPAPSRPAATTSSTSGYAGPLVGHRRVGATGGWRLTGSITELLGIG